MRRALVGFLLAFSLLGAACGGDEGAAESTGGSGTGGGDGTATTELVAADFKFDPADLSVATGGSIELTNEDDAKHSLTAEDAGIDQDVDPMASTTVDLGDAEPGTYDYICKYHPEMKGTLEVTE